MHIVTYTDIIPILCISKLCFSHFLIAIYTNERLTDIYATSTSRPLIAHQPIAYLTIASFMLSTIYFTSSSVTYGPAGKQKPTLKSFSSIPLV